MADLAKLVEELSKLSVLEASELVKLLEEKWGVSAAAPVAAMSAMPAGAAAAAAVDSAVAHNPCADACADFYEYKVVNIYSRPGAQFA